jgi:hypothetical protein
MSVFSWPSKKFSRRRDFTEIWAVTGRWLVFVRVMKVESVWPGRSSRAKPG